MFSSPVDTALDFISLAAMVSCVFYIIKLYHQSRNPVIMLFSPLVFFKYLVFLVALVVTFFVADVIADEILNNPLLSVYSFDFGLALGSSGILMITRRVYEQVVHPEKRENKRRLRKELDEVRRRRIRFKDEQFREENR